MKVSYSAPAKTILSGEHSVVYGKPALVTALDLRLQFTIEDSSLNKVVSDKAIQEIKKIVIHYLEKNTIPFEDRPFQYSISSKIPIGRGMGSSAAFSVASVAALFHFLTRKNVDKDVITQLSYLAEKYFHGTPSGVDSSASTLGGLIFYRKEFEFLKQISSLNFKIPENIRSSLYLIDSGKPHESTAEMVKLVGKKYNDNPEKIEQILSKIERVTKRMVVSIVKEDIKLFESAIKENNILLIQLGIVSDTTEKFLSRLEEFGTGKVTGAGGIQSGSGFILFVAKDSQGLENYCEKNVISYFKFHPDLEGVREVNI